MDRFSHGRMGITRKLAVPSPVRDVKMVFSISALLLNTSSLKEVQILRAFQAGVLRISPRGKKRVTKPKERMRRRLGFFREIRHHSTVCRCGLG